MSNYTIKVKRLEKPLSKWILCFLADSEIDINNIDPRHYLREGLFWIFIKPRLDQLMEEFGDVTKVIDYERGRFRRTYLSRIIEIGKEGRRMQAGKMIVTVERFIHDTITQAYAS